MDGKTKKVNGVDCSRHCFSYAPDDDTAHWILPVWIPGDTQKSVNAVKSSFGRFDSAKIPDGEREHVWFTLYGALLAHGIKADRRTFAQSPAPKAVASAAPAEPKPAVPTPAAPVEVKAKKDPIVEEAIALGDRRATAILRSLGLE